jgi:hypothetical protein
MRFMPGKADSRREFFRATARYGLLALVSAAATLAARRRPVAGEQCVNRGICSGCVVFADCGLPQALSAKSVKGLRR